MSYLHFMILMIGGKCILLDVLNSFTPLRSVSSRKSKRPTPWFNKCIAANIKAKNRAKRIATRSGSEEDKKCIAD